MNTPLLPDRISLEIAHRKLNSELSLDEMLKSQTYRRILNGTAIKYMKNRERFDIKKVQANDHD